jgi:hypothetical protein
MSQMSNCRRGVKKRIGHGSDAEKERAAIAEKERAAIAEKERAAIVEHDGGIPRESPRKLGRDRGRAGNSLSDHPSRGA